MNYKLNIRNLRASTDGKEILRGVDLEVGEGEMHVLMGPNGSGKSTLAQVIMGAPQFRVDPTSPLRLRSGLRGASSSSIMFDGKDLTKLTPDKRARLGIFLGFQHPVEVPGVSVFNMLRRAKQSIAGPVDKSRWDHLGKRHLRGESSSHLGGGGIASGGIREFRQELLEYASSLKLSNDFLGRSLNEGFSGGEKKRNEILQMMALRPKLVILDEIDSGLDVDGLKIVANAIKKFMVHSSQSSVILITHYARILKYFKPDFVHVMITGKIVKSGTSKLAVEIEKSGYERFVLGIKDQISNIKMTYQNSIT